MALFRRSQLIILICFLYVCHINVKASDSSVSNEELSSLSSSPRTTESSDKSGSSESSESGETGVENTSNNTKVDPLDLSNIPEEGREVIGLPRRMKHRQGCPSGEIMDEHGQCRELI
ncbi:GSCOCG00004849001-RA-CDS [Cotesia congregata]|nr:GSCOCG00004849001-RA-CDS [Cotesia congregata]